MSYILDALRKADAQREGNPARGIHAQPTAPAPAASTYPQWPVWVACAAVLVCAVVLLVVEGRDPAAHAPAAVAQTAAKPVTQVAAAPVAVAAPQAPAAASVIVPP